MEAGTVKELRRNTAACEACQERKRKCDGKAPCSFCVGKKIECKFSQQKKRGPSKKRRMIEAEAENVHAVATINTTHESALFDRIEAQRYLTMYFRFDYNSVMSSSNIETLLSARTPQHQVQLFAALADAAQSCGDFVKGRTYINQARLLSGSIYDSVDGDSVKGLMMMRKYWYHTLDFVQCTHYSNISWSLAKLVKGGLDTKIKMYCQLSANMSDFSTSLDEKLVFLRQLIASRRKSPIGTPENWLFQHYLEFAAGFMEHFHFNIFYPSEESVTTIFKDLKNVSLDERSRIKMLESINAIQIEISSLSADECTSIVLVNRVFCPMYQMLINWKSGHLAEAMANALACISAFDALRSLNAAITNTNLLALVVGYTHICMLGSMMQFFVEQGQLKLAERVEGHITSICKTRGPEYNAIENFMAEFRRAGFVVPPTNKQDLFLSSPSSCSTTIITPLTPESTSPPTTSSPPTSSEQIPSPPSVTSSTTPPTTLQEDLDAQINSLQLCAVSKQINNINNSNNNINSNNLENNNNNNNNGINKILLDIDITKPLTPQLVEQLRAINLNSSFASRYEGDMLKVNNAIVFQKVDPNIYNNASIRRITPSSSPSSPLPSSSSPFHSSSHVDPKTPNVYNYENSTQTIQQDNNNNNLMYNPPVTSNTFNNNNNNNNNIHTSQSNVQSNTNNTQNNNSYGTTTQNYYPNYNNTSQTQQNIQNYLPHPSYQLHPSLQQANHHLYHTTYQLPSHPSIPPSHPLPSHPSSSLPHPSSHSHPPLPHSTSSHPSPSPSPALFYNDSSSPPTNFTPTTTLYGNYNNFPTSPSNTINSNPETNQDMLSLIDQFLCPTEGYTFVSQDTTMGENQVKY